MKTSVKNTNQVINIENLIAEHSIDFKNPNDLDILIEKIGEAKYVLLGEASHGTHEYYVWRAHISRKLIEQKGFSFIAVEGDWPDCYLLNRYIKSYADSGKDARTVLHAFNRWPTWMWANWEVIALTEWLKGYNQTLSNNQKIGFYGLDVYSLWESLEAIIKYLEKVDKHALKKANRVLDCFELYGSKEEKSAHLSGISCEDEIIDLLRETSLKLSQYNTDPEAALNLEQNTHTLKNAEKYYRTLMKGNVNSWNLRDHHMVDTLDRLMKYHDKDAKAIIWEHNTHIGDSRATEMDSRGMVNVGRLAREKYGRENVYSVGFGSNSGTVIAGMEWGDAMRVMNVPFAVEGSWENLLHKLEAKDRIIFSDNDLKEEWDNARIWHRAIGVVYNPKYEHYGNYVPSIIPERYDAFVYIDKTKALHPLHIEPEGSQMPETYPFNI